MREVGHEYPPKSAQAFDPESRGLYDDARSRTRIIEAATKSISRYISGEVR